MFLQVHAFANFAKVIYKNLITKNINSREFCVLMNFLSHPQKLTSTKYFFFGEGRTVSLVAVRLS